MTSSMSASRWREIRAVFDAVVDLDAATRERRLSELAADPELHAAVQSLLAADAAADDCLRRLDFHVVASNEESAHASGCGTHDPFGFVGRTVAHFRITSLLDAGGMGVLYRAYDTQLMREVALKFPLPWSLRDASAKQRFLREGRAAGALDHPNLCNVYEVGETPDGQLFLAMALYSGETVKARLERVGALSVEESISIVRQVARGIGAAHAAGIVHRDLKPANLMVLADGTVKILDFGLAKGADPSLTGSRTQLGTIAYMAPEQVRGGTIDARTDLWAIGVVLYELVTGRRPFAGEHDLAVAHAIVHVEPAPPATLQCNLSPELEDLILRLLHKTADRRMGSAAELDAALAAIPSARAAGASASLHAAVRKLRFALARTRFRLAAVIMLFALAGGVLSWQSVANGTPAHAESRASNAQAQLFYDRARDYEDRVESPDNVNAAMSLYQRALALDPTFALAHARLALTYAKLYIAGYDRSEARLEQIRTAAAAALQLQPDIAEAHLALGHYWDEGKREERWALQSFEHALRGLPNSAELHAALARLYRGQARWDDAIAAYKRALTLNPNLLNVAVDLAFTYSLLRRYDLAIPLIDSVIALQPDDHAARLSKGYMVMRRDGTLDTLAAALARVPPDWNPQGMGVWARTVIARAERRPERALAVLNAAPSEWMGKGPMLLSRTLIRAQVYEELGDTVRARADYDNIRHVLEDSASAYPTDASWRILLGLSYAGLQRRSDAAREALRAMELMPWSRDAIESVRVMVGAAEIFARAGDADNALRLLDRLLSVPAGPAATVPLLRLEPNWDALRRDPRFDQLLERHARSGTAAQIPLRM